MRLARWPHVMVAAAAVVLAIVAAAVTVVVAADVNDGRRREAIIAMQLSGPPRSLDKRWYLGVLCRRCKARILFARDFSDGQHDPMPAAKLVLTCGQPECGHKADYSNAKISRFQ